MQFLGPRFAWRASVAGLVAALAAQELAYAGSARLVVDVNPLDREMRFKMASGLFLGDDWYFIADDDRHGRELWRTDGSTAGTRMVADLCPGECSGLEWHQPIHLAQRGRLLFWGDDGSAGIEPWLTDGTAEGTTPLADLSPGPASSGLRAIGFSSRHGYFTKRSADHCQLWASDGTQTGTVVLASMATVNYNPSCDFEFWGQVSVEPYFLFARRDYPPGYRLYASDGTSTGTKPILSSPSLFQSVPNGRRALVRTEGRIFETDGTAEGTWQIADLELPVQLFRWQDSVFARVGATGERRLLRFDGREFQSFSAPAAIREAEYLVFGNDWLVAWTRYGAAWSMRQDGTVEQLIESDVYNFWPTIAGDELFVDRYSTSSSELWASGADPRSMRRIATAARLEGVPWDSVSGPTVLGVAASGRALIGFGDQVFSVPSGGEATVLRTRVRAGRSSGPTALVASGADVFWKANDGEFSSLWVSSPGRSSRLADLWATSGRTVGGAIVPIRGAVVTNRFAVPRLGGAATDLCAGQCSLIEARAWKDQLVFLSHAAGDGWHTTRSIWATDATPRGSMSLAEFPAAYFCGIPEGCEDIPRRHLPTIVGDRLIFFADLEIANQLGLWSMSSPSEIPRLVASFRVRDWAPNQILVWRNQLYFFLDHADKGWSLWKTDGEQVTMVAEHSSTPPRSQSPELLMPAGSRLQYAIRDAAGWDSIWSTDGTPEGTRAEFPIALDGRRGRVEAGIPFGDRHLLRIYTAETGAEPWITNGTPKGTRLIRDLRPGPLSSSPNSLLSLGDRVFFSADDGRHGIEPWITNGTPAGTRLVEDLNPGSDGSEVRDPVLAGNSVYFHAYHPDSGRELWMIPTAAIPELPCLSKPGCI